MSTITLSDIWFAASIAAEKALPEESLALIKRRDHLQKEWSASGYAGITPEALVAAREAIDKDPLASAAMEMRIIGNKAWHEERKNTEETTNRHA